MSKLGVGDLISKWIPEWIQKDHDIECDCKKVKQELNASMPDQIELHIQYYIDHFINQKRHLRFGLRLIPDFILRMFIRAMIKKATSQIRQS